MRHAESLSLAHSSRSGDERYDDKGDDEMIEESRAACVTFSLWTWMLLSNSKKLQE